VAVFLFGHLVGLYSLHFVARAHLAYLVIMASKRGLKCSHELCAADPRTRFSHRQGRSKHILNAAMLVHLKCFAQYGPNRCAECSYQKDRFHIIMNAPQRNPSVSRACKRLKDAMATDFACMHTCFGLQPADSLLPYCQISSRATMYRHIKSWDDHPNCSTSCPAFGRLDKVFRSTSRVFCVISF